MPPSVENDARPKPTVQRTIQTSPVTQKQRVSTPVSPTRARNNSTVTSRPGAPVAMKKTPSQQVATASATTAKKAPSQQNLNSDAHAAQQQEKHASGATAKPGAFQARSPPSPGKPTPPSSPSRKPLTQVEMDAQAKSTARATTLRGMTSIAPRASPGGKVPPSPVSPRRVVTVNGGGGAASRPGAVAVVNASLDGLETAVMAKARRASASSAKPAMPASPSPAKKTAVTQGRKVQTPDQPSSNSLENVHSQLSQLEADLAAKKLSRGSPAPAVPTTPQGRRVQTPYQPPSNSLEKAHSQLSQLEADVAVKVSRGSPAAAPGGVAVNGTRARAELKSLEEAVAKKVRGEKGSRAGVLSSLRQLESDALAKAGTSSGDTTQLKDKASIGRRIGAAEGLMELERMEAKILQMEANNSDDDDAEDDDTITREEKDGPKTNTTDHGVNHIPDAELAQGDKAAEGLAVAVPINDDGEGPQVAAVATSYDPDAKPIPVHKTKRFIASVIISIIIMVVAIAAIIGILLVTADAETVEAISPREMLGIREEIETLIGAEELESFESPYSKALDWLIHQDPMALVPQDSNFFQRYIMAYLYFATTATDPWRSCNPPVGMEQESCHLTVLEPMQYPPTFTTVPANRWLTSVHECDFGGVKCDAGMRILEIYLNGAGMSGTFPTGIVHIPYLQVIKFSAGSMTGPLPSEIIMSLKHLRSIDLQMNEFTGEIPKEWWEAKRLTSINLAYNQIKGTIPITVQDMKDLKSLNLHDNKLSGPIPTELGNIPNLEHLRLGHNDLKGPIPTEFGQLTHLETLWLDRNLLTGTLPVEMSNMTMLNELSLGENPRLGGTIPDEFYNKLTQMGWLELYSCNFTGPISPLIGNMKGLYVVLLNDNSFTGTIPAELATLRRDNTVYLETLSVQNNNFQGRMPQEVCEQRVKNDLEVGISTLAADCAPDPTTGQVELECDCCTECCTPDGGACSDKGTRKL